MNQQLQQQMTPGPYKNFSPGETVVNPVDGKSYNVQQQTPGKGVTLIDPQTQQTVMVDEQNAQNLEKSIQTSSLSVENIANEIVSNLLGEELPEIPQMRKKKSGVIAMQKANRWAEIRKKLKTRSNMTEKEISQSPTYNEKRQDSALRELKQKKAAFNPYKGEDIDNIGRDRKTGLPIVNNEHVEVGMTEFPKDTDKEKNPEGYGKMTMKEMDEKFEEERPHFDNEKLLPDYTKKREESTTYKPKWESDEERERYAALDEALNKVLGISKTSADEIDPSQPTKLPVRYKEVKRAPKLEEYTEPDVLKEAPPDVKTAIEMIKSTQEKIQELQNQINEKTAPLQKAIMEATKDLQADLAKSAALLSSTLSLVYEELEKTEDKVAVLGDEIYAAISREEAKAKPATLAQIIKKAEELNPKVAEEINKIKALIESDNTTLVLEQFLYKYPVSDVQKKKISESAFDGDLDLLVSELIGIVDELQEINETL